jgi:peptidoglycan-N-acetylmuramic acid deacetylase
MKKTIIKILILAAVCLMFTSAASAECMSWYCVRNKEHKQPRVDSALSFVEKYDGYYIDHKHGDDCDQKVVYLTFDAGYENGNIEKILDVMKDENVTGAFFVLKNLVLKNTDLVKRMAKEGHLVCNHTASHKDMTKCASFEEFKTELEKMETIYHEATGNIMARYYRPPEGKFDTASLKYAKQLGYKTVFWSFAYADWDNGKQMSPKEAKQKILSNIHNGEVMLLHPTSATNAAILGDVIRELKAQGYRFGTLDELCAK